jgi:hypothetical protein
MWKSQSTITIPGKGNAEVTITELLSKTLGAARSVLIDVRRQFASRIYVTPNALA